MFKEDLAPFFADFAVPAVFNGEAGQVLFDHADQLEGDIVLSAEYTITYATGLFPGLSHESRITVDGEEYEVRGAPARIEDGAVTRATLSKP